MNTTIVAASTGSRKSSSRYQPGTEVGRFIIRRFLGRGGMGSVFEAWDPVLRREVALKVLRPQDESDWKRFRREAQILATLVHPNIATVHEVGEHAGAPYIVMPLIDGVPLTHPALPLRRRIIAVRDAALALHYAHGRGVVHRDVKPSNIMVELPEHRAVILDFGIARRRQVETTVTKTGFVIGTPEYISPERAADPRHAEPRSDIYSLGVTLYEALTDRRPFEDPGICELLRKVFEDEPERLTRVNDRLDRPLETIVHKCLEKEPARRYGTALELADDLSRWLTGQPVLAKPPSIFYKVKRYFSRRRAVYLPAAATLLLAGTAWIAGSWWARARNFEEASMTARTAFGAGQWKEAREACAAALAIRPDAHLGALEKDCVEKIAALEAAAAAAGGVKTRLTLEERVESVTAALRDAHLFPYVPAIDLRKKLEPVEAALADLEGLAASSGGDAKTHALLACGWHFVEDHRRAAACARRALELDPADRIAAYVLGRLRFEEAVTLPGLDACGEPDAGAEAAGRTLIDQARALLRHGEAPPFGHRVIRGDALEILRIHLDGGREEAERRCLAALVQFGTEPGCEEYWMVLALLRTGDERIQACTEALKIRPHFALAQLVLAANRPLSQARERIADYTAAQHLQPHSERPVHGRALLRLNGRDLEGALEDLNEAVRIASDVAPIRFARGVVHLRGHSLPEALVDLSTAIELSPEDARARYHRGLVHHKLRNSQAAIADFTDSLALAPGIPETLAHRGTVRRKAGDLTGAREDFQAALRRATPSWSHRNHVAQELAEVEAALAAEAAKP